MQWKSTEMMHKLAWDTHNAAGQHTARQFTLNCSSNRTTATGRHVDSEASPLQQDPGGSSTHQDEKSYVIII